MRTARPKWLVRSRRWGAWVPGGVVERDMLICVRTRSGKSWFSKVKEVLDQRATGAICERIDIVEEKLMTQEIPFLDHDYLDGDLDHLAPKRICHEQVLDTIAKAFRPASAIENYEYYEDYKWNCAFYQTVLDQVIQIVSSQILEMTDGQNGEGELQLGASGVDREAQRSVLTPVPTARTNRRHIVCSAVASATTVYATEVAPERK